MEENTISLKAELKPDENGKPTLVVKSYQFTANNAKDLCPSNNCIFDITNSRLRPNYYPSEPLDFDVQFDGILKAIIIVTKNETKLFHMGIYLEIFTSSTEIEGTMMLKPGIDTNIKYIYKILGTLDLHSEPQLLVIKGEFSKKLS
jgi:hypothetical protein